MDTVLFACVHSAGRSQMAAAWFNKICDRTKASAVSAGTEPGERVHPEVVQVMKEEDFPSLTMDSGQTICRNLISSMQTS